MHRRVLEKKSNKLLLCWLYSVRGVLRAVFGANRQQIHGHGVHAQLQWEVNLTEIMMCDHTRSLPFFLLSVLSVETLFLSIAYSCCVKTIVIFVYVDRISDWILFQASTAQCYCV